MLHVDAETQSTPPLPVPPDFQSEVASLRAQNEAYVLEQVYANDLFEDTYPQFQRLAHNTNMTVDQWVKFIAENPGAASLVAKDPTKGRAHERISYRYCESLASHPETPILAAAQLPTGGKNALYVTSQGVRHGDERGRLRTVSSSIDINTFVSNWSVYQYHKYTTDEGGSQDNVFEVTRDHAVLCRKHRTNEGRLHRSLDPHGAFRPVLHLIVVDGPYWNEDRKRQIRRAGKACTTPTPGGLMVCTTAELLDVYNAIAATN